MISFGKTAIAGIARVEDVLTPATLCTALNAVMRESDASAAISGARPSGGGGLKLR